jgi:hypothetical protein
MLPTRRRPAGRRAPLPDPVAADPPALHRVPVPDSLPPYDGERRPRTSRSADQPGPVEDGPGPPAHEPDQAENKPDKPASAGPAIDRRAVPGPGGWPSRFAQVLAETLAGSRPAQQLAPWTTEQTRQRIRELGPMMASGQRPRVRRVMTSAPAANVLELTAVVGFGARVRVLALRLERADDCAPGWQCTALESA